MTSAATCLAFYGIKWACSARRDPTSEPITSQIVYQKTEIQQVKNRITIDNLCKSAIPMSSQNQSFLDGPTLGMFDPSDQPDHCQTKFLSKPKKHWATQTNFWPTAHLANFWKTSNRLIGRFLRKFGPTHDQPINHFLFWNTQNSPCTRPETLSLREGDLTVPVVEKLL